MSKPRTAPWGTWLRAVGAAGLAGALAAGALSVGVAGTTRAEAASGLTFVAGQTRPISTCWTLGSPGDPVHLQRWDRERKSWVTIAKARKAKVAASLCRSRIGVTFQWRPREAGTVRLRLLSLETATYASFASKAFTVRVVRPASGPPGGATTAAPAPIVTVTVSAPGAPSAPVTASATTSSLAASVWKGAPKQVPGVCTDPSCAWVMASVSNFPPNRSFTGTLSGGGASGYWSFTINTDGNGNWSGSTGSVFGYPGSSVSLSVNVDGTTVSATSAPW